MDSAKLEAPRLVKRPRDWKRVSRPQNAEIVRTLINPVRMTILEALDRGPIRQYELAKLIRKVTGKKYDDTVLSYHLSRLSRVGLIGFKLDRASAARIKMVYRAADFDVHLRSTDGFEVRLRPRRAPSIRISKPPKIPEDFVENLKRKYQGSIF